MVWNDVMYSECDLISPYVTKSCESPLNPQLRFGKRDDIRIKHLTIGSVGRYRSANLLCRLLLLA
jgi:hypothetical protein